MKFRTVLPEGLVHSDCACFNVKVFGWFCWIRVISNKTAKLDEKPDENKHSGSVKIKVSDYVTKTYMCFKSSDTESTIILIGYHEGILNDLKLKEKYNFALKDVSKAVCLLKLLEEEINLDVLASGDYHSSLMDVWI